MVPEAYDAKAMLCDQVGAPVIFSCLIQVMASVELDYESGLRACEVGDEISDCELLSEVKSVEALCS